MFNRFRDEDGVIGNFFILASVILFVTAIGFGFGVGKYVQSGTLLKRCGEMTAKATMVVMERQAPPKKGVLTQDAMDTGMAMFAQSMCNQEDPSNPLMAGTQNFKFEMITSDTLLVTITMKQRGYLLNRWFPVNVQEQGVAYTYQYGGKTKSPKYDGSLRSGGPIVGNSSLGASAPTQNQAQSPGSGGEATSSQQGDDGGLLSSAPPPVTTGGGAVVVGEQNTPSKKVTICHGTNSKKNPYQQISVSKNAIDNPNGHGKHTGSLAPADNPGDIIPPFDGFPGLNWPQGQAIWENGCSVP